MLSLILAALDNEEDRTLLTQYYNSYQYSMLHVALSILHDRGLAEDAVQEAFLRVADHMNRVRKDPKQVRSYLVTITRNVAFDHLKSWNSVKTLSWDTLVCEPADSVNVEELVAQDDEFDRIAQSLPIIYSSVFLLRYKHDCGDSEIAALLSIKEPTVRKRLQRAKEKITDVIQQREATYNV